MFLGYMRLASEISSCTSSTLHPVSAWEVQTMQVHHFPSQGSLVMLLVMARRQRGGGYGRKHIQHSLHAVLSMQRRHLSYLPVSRHRLQMLMRGRSRAAPVIARRSHMHSKQQHVQPELSCRLQRTSHCAPLQADVAAGFAHAGLAVEAVHDGPQVVCLPAGKVDTNVAQGMDASVRQADDVAAIPVHLCSRYSPVSRSQSMLCSCLLKSWQSRTFSWCAVAATMI